MKSELPTNPSELVSLHFLSIWALRHCGVGSCLKNANKKCVLILKQTDPKNCS